MDNQQERSHFNKGWLAGIIDGEGCLQLAKQRYKGKYHYRPLISIGNTNPEIIEKVIEIAKENKPYYVLNRKKPAFRSKRESWVVSSFGFQRCKVWLEYLGDSLQGKNVQARLMKEYIDYRLSLPHAYDVTEKDDNYKKAISEANQRFKGEIPNDYTPSRTDNVRKI